MANRYSQPSVHVGDLATFYLNVTALTYYEGDRKVTDETIANNQLRMYVSFGINSLSTIFILYIILRFSPNNMGIYKYLLVNISAWSYVSDAVLTLLWMPLPMMPAPSICISGLLKGLGQFEGNGLAFVSFMFTFAGCNVSCFTAQLYRIFASTGRDTAVFTQRWFIALSVFAHCFAASPGIIGYFFTVELDNDSLIRYQIANFPFMKSVVYKLPCGGFIVDETNKKFLYFFLTVFACMTTGIIINVTMLTYLLLSLKQSFKNSVSLRNSQLQRQLVTVLVVQTLLPTICLCIPYSFIILTALTYNPVLSSLATALIAIGSLHSFFHAACLVIMIKPYKTAVMTKMWQWKEKVSRHDLTYTRHHQVHIQHSATSMKSIA